MSGPNVSTGKKSSNSLSFSEATNVAAQDSGLAISAEGPVSLTTTDHGAIRAASALSRDSLGLARSTFTSGLEANSSALSQAFESFAFANRGQNEQLLSETQGTIRTLIIVAGGALALMFLGRAMS